jgi:hypothetical protein
LDAVNAAAATRYYASTSIFTFVTAVNLLKPCGIASEGYLVAVAAMMAAPTIMSALWLAARTPNARSTATGPNMSCAMVPSSCCLAYS